MNKVYFIGWVVLVLYVLLETDAPVKYAKLLRLKWMKYEEFEKSKDLFQTYKFFLNTRYPNFFTNLITCQECLAVWLCIVGFLLFGQSLGGWWAFGITALGCIKGIAIFKFILRKVYE